MFFQWPLFLRIFCIISSFDFKVPSKVRTRFRPHDMTASLGNFKGKNEQQNSFFQIKYRSCFLELDMKMSVLKTFLIFLFWTPFVLTEDETTTSTTSNPSCRQSLRIALKSIFEEHEANNAVCVRKLFSKWDKII